MTRVSATARTLNPSLHILICSPHTDEAQRLNADQLGEVFVADELLAEAMARRAITVRTQGSTPGRSA